ncbi:uncharacterized protein LOC124160435 [Ischnura elegans]|uniref:uncharacterized protein LOC124160435 n=1 Tax=Ischnura elegans TaxID=197161 RepID=UPI001ED892A1|nr:uncharacterized protein LOC124160435 [Ischnura elegans]
MIPGFSKGQSDNLPAIDAVMVAEFMSQNSNFVGAEIRGMKTARAGRESYGDNALGYVQVRREGAMCTVKAKVTPEHKLRGSGYKVKAVINEDEDKVLAVECEDCAASTGGCKHAVALLFWLHRRSEEPAKTSTECYWKKSRLSSIGTGKKFITADEMGRAPVALNVSEEDRELFVKSVPRRVNSRRADDFVDYCSHNVTDRDIIAAEKDTEQQGSSEMWHSLRYGRITASKLHEAAHCHTKDGVLVETILGAYRIDDNLAMSRGRNLEVAIKNVVESKLGVKISDCGLFLRGDYPVLGASPDGIDENNVFEFKCPISLSSYAKYIVQCNGSFFPAKQHFAQMQLQMLMTGRRKGYFCVARPDFEDSQEVEIVSVDYDQHKCMALINNAMKFWKENIFPVMYNSLF